MAKSYTYTDLQKIVLDVTKDDPSIAFLHVVYNNLRYIYEERYDDELETRGDLVKALNLFAEAGRRQHDADRRSDDYELYNLAQLGAYGIFKREMKRSFRQYSGELVDDAVETAITRLFNHIVVRL